MPRRPELTLTAKIELLEKIKSQPPETSQRRLAKLVGISKSSIARLLQQEHQLREALQKGRAGTSKRRRTGKNPTVEKALDQWLSMVSGHNVPINGPVLKKKAEEIAGKLGFIDFKATAGWLSRWKARNNIKFKPAHCQKIEDPIAIKNETFYADDNLPCYDINEDCVEAIVKVIQTEEKFASQHTADNVPPLPVTFREASRCIEVLQRYFMQVGNEASPTAALNICAEYVKAQFNKKRQSTLDNFLIKLN